VASGCGAGEPRDTTPKDELRQHQITAPGDLLTTDGRLREPGWATTDLLRWDPERVADPSKLRQWDFFTIANGQVAVNLTLADVTFQLGSVGVVEMDTGAASSSVVLASTDGLALSAELGEDASVHGASGDVAFTAAGTDTVVTIDISNPPIGSPVQGSLTIHRRPEMPFLSLATPFTEDAHDFFYEQKIPGLTAEGTLTVGDRTWTFAPADTIAVMDWGRGQWPPMITWQWASGSGEVEGTPFAFNLGGGFGEDRAGTENIVFFGDVPTKLGRVTWKHDPADLLADWTFRDDDGRLSLVLHPLAPEVSNLDLGSKYSHVRKAYGRFSGTVVAAGGHTLSIEGILGAAEEEDASW
jgi:hypothetical protein